MALDDLPVRERDNRAGVLYCDTPPLINLINALTSWLYKIEIV